MKPDSYNINMSFKINEPLLKQFESFCNSTGYSFSGAVRDGLVLLFYKHHYRNTGNTSESGLSSEW